MNILKGSPGRFPMNAIHFPSGDHRGNSMFVMPVVLICCGDEPSEWATQRVFADVCT
jgi:hypothetical protein